MAFYLWHHFIDSSTQEYVKEPFYALHYITARFSRDSLEVQIEYYKKIPLGTLNSTDNAIQWLDLQQTTNHASILVFYIVNQAWDES